MQPGLGAIGFVLGTVISSFGATWAIRRARGEQVLAGRSSCDHCRHVLSYAETVPLVGFALQGGHCRHCNIPIDRFHSAAELGGGLLLGITLLVRAWPLSVVEGALAITLYVLALVDLKTLTLPNIGVAVAAVFCLLLGGVSHDLSINLIIAIIIGLALTGLAEGMKRVRGRTMLGGGDIKLLAALSLWQGPDICLALALGSLLGLLQVWLFPARPGLIAFGPALIAGALIMGLCIRPWFTLGGL
jgi:leader peptidase (prepilin peptidase)/N-methyltransferase